MNIQHDKKDTTGKFYISEENQIIAQMTYTIEEDRLIIEHTMVDKPFRGKNIGAQLVNEGVKFADETGIKIVPVCKFAKKVLEGNERYKKVLAESY